MQLVFGVFLICFSETMQMNFTFFQNDFVLKYERLEVARFNPEYYSTVWTKTRKFNRTQAVSEVMFVLDKNIRNPYKMEVQAYKFSSNEYRHFPARFSYSFCEALRKDDFGVANILMCGNLSLAGCPFKKGVFYTCEFYLDGSKFPPHVPEGDYMVDLKFFEGDTETIFLQGYGSIKYKNFWLH